MVIRCSIWSGLWWGVIAAFDQVGSHDDVGDALAALKETPRSRDRPVYRAYEFERSTVRAGKEATIGVALRDVRHARIWRSEVRQREMRELAVLEGLDPRDRDYEQHRAGALSPEEFEHWQQQPPQLPMSALVAALVEQGGTDAGPRPRDSELIAEATPTVAPVDWLAAAQAEQQDASGLPGSRRSRRAQGPAPDRPAPLTQRLAQVEQPASVSRRSTARHDGRTNRGRRCARSAGGERGAARCGEPPGQRRLRSAAAGRHHDRSGRAHLGDRRHHQRWRGSVGLGGPYRRRARPCGRARPAGGSACPAVRRPRIGVGQMVEVLELVERGRLG